MVHHVLGIELAGVLGEGGWGQDHSQPRGVDQGPAGAWSASPTMSWTTT